MTTRGRPGRLTAWIARRVGAVAAFLGGVSLLGLAVSVVAVTLGEHRFPAPSSSTATFGTYAWQIGALAAGSILVWRVCFAIVARAGSEEDALVMLGYPSEAHRPATGALAALVRCTACGVRFSDNDAALDHAYDVCGREMTREEGIRLLEPLD